jgi:phosphohistidine phosphatase
MRRLWLLRHAKSSWDEPHLADHDRPLSARGRRAADAIGRWVDETEVRPDVVLCSSARRARETLAAVLPGLGGDVAVLVEAGLYTFHAEDLLARVRELPDGAASALLVGHNPAIEDLIVRLAREGNRLDEARAKVPTGTLAGLDLEIDAWRDAATGVAILTTFVIPRDLGNSSDAD